MAATAVPDDFAALLQPPAYSEALLDRTFRPRRNVPDDARGRIMQRPDDESRSRMFNAPDPAALSRAVKSIAEALGPSRARLKASVAAYSLLLSCSARWVLVPETAWPELALCLGLGETYVLKALEKAPETPTTADDFAALDAEAVALLRELRAGKRGMRLRRAVFDLLRREALGLWLTPLVFNTFGAATGVVDPRTGQLTDAALSLAMGVRNDPLPYIEAASRDGKRRAVKKNGRKVDVLTQEGLIEKAKGVAPGEGNFVRTLQRKRVLPGYRRLMSLAESEAKAEQARLKWYGLAAPAIWAKWNRVEALKLSV